MINALNDILKSKNPEYYAKLQPGVSDTALDSLEGELGHKLPALFRELYKWRNGQPPSEFADFQPSQGVMFMSLEDIQLTIADLRELQEFGDLEPGVWSTSWLPFLDNGGGNHLCLNLTAPGDPTIVYHDHEVPAGDIVANSMREWLESLINEWRESGA